MKMTRLFFTQRRKGAEALRNGNSLDVFHAKAQSSKGAKELK